jgi:hypothetical protein
VSRLLRSGLLLAALALALLARLPATLLDARLHEASGAKAHLALAMGTVWDGQGRLLVADERGGWRPWHSVSWRVEVLPPWQGLLAIRLVVDSRPEGRVVIGWRGVEVTALTLGGSAATVAGLLPEVAGRAGWRGDLVVSVPRWHCDWSWHCTGQGVLDWLAAGNDLFPGRPLGDYRITATGTDGDVKLAWTTLGGDIRIEGDGLWRPGARPAFTGMVTGDAAFLERLPSVAGQWARRGDAPGRWRVDIRP